MTWAEVAVLWVGFVGTACVVAIGPLALAGMLRRLQRAVSPDGDGD